MVPTALGMAMVSTPVKAVMVPILVFIIDGPVFSAQETAETLPSR